MTTTGKFPAALLALTDVGADTANIKTAILSGAHNSAVTTITLTATVPSEWPTAGWVTIDGEIISYTGKSGATLTTCTRGTQTAYGAGVAAAHSDQAIVAPYLTAQQVNQVIADLIAAQTKVGTGASTPASNTVLVGNGAGTSAWSAKAGSIITIATEQATTSGTSIDFTGIPAGAKRIVVMLVGVSTNGVSPLLLQLGDSGGIETAGYTSTATRIVNATGITAANSSAGLLVTTVSAAGDAAHGKIVIDLEDSSDNTWVATSTIHTDTTSMYIAAGSKATSATLDRIRLTTVGGADTFDAGAMSISYE